MGVIKKTLYRGNILGKPRHRNLFLDMEENIHIHYRDLRIEMGRGEFEDFASIFLKQSKELQTIINEKNYQDGALPNANQDDERIWTESRLKHDVKYHPQRFSLEECGDGYHFHYRNYKFLIDPAEFKHIAQLFKKIDVNSVYASTYDEVLELLEENDVDFSLDAGNIPGELLKIAVAKHHIPKIRDIFNYIGFSQEIVGEERRYTGTQITVVASVDKLRTALDYKRFRGLSHTGRLVDYLSRNGVAIDPNELNQIKCQVIDLYSVLKTGKTVSVETDHQLWLYSPANKKIIFPYSQPVRGGKIEAEAVYKAWSGLLARLQLGFVKPDKEVFAADEQVALQLKIVESLNKDVAAFAAVDKIYMMGSAVRRDMGRYLAPFVHGKLAKLGSDVDILVEINPARESDIPAHWHLINQESSNHCAVYHVAQITLSGGGDEWTKQYPNMEFSHHIIDAYVFLPSRGYHKEKDEFLKKFAAKLFYDRTRDGIISRGGEDARIVTRLKELYMFSNVMVEKMKVSTENAIYKVFTGENDYILKLFKVSGNYSRSRVTEHTDYEESLINQLRARGIQTAGIIPTQQRVVSTIETFPALLFERIPGVVQQRPEYSLDSICAALAKIHLVQMEQPLTLPVDFTFDDICLIWLPLFSTYLMDQRLPQEIAKVFAETAPLAERFNPGEHRAPMYARSHAVHNHGDVTPKNVIVNEKGESYFFDFNNAFFGPRMVDIVDGAFEFSLAEKYIHLADFNRFDAFISDYAENNPLSAEEREDLPKWIELIGIIKCIKEVRVLLERPTEELRKKRALAIAGFILSRREKC